MLSGSLAPLKVVVVDDDPMIRMVVGRCLTHFGATATLCENAVSGIQAVQQIRPQVVLSDLIMPERDGFYLLPQIKAPQLADRDCRHYGSARFRAGTGARARRRDLSAKAVHSPGFVRCRASGDATVLIAREEVRIPIERSLSADSP